MNTTLNLSAELLQLPASLEARPFNLPQAAPQLRHLLLRGGEVLLQHSQLLLRLLTQSLQANNTNAPSYDETVHAQRLLDLLRLPDSLGFRAAQSFSQLSV